MFKRFLRLAAIIRPKTNYPEYVTIPTGLVNTITGEHWNLNKMASGHFWKTQQNMTFGPQSIPSPASPDEVRNPVGVARILYERSVNPQLKVNIVNESPSEWWARVSPDEMLYV